jgi:drug/metabolite transporter (DMT)-like permease
VTEALSTTVRPSTGRDRREPLSRRGVALCLVSATGFGLAAVVAKQAYRSGVNVDTMLSARFGIAAVAFWLIVAWRRPTMPSVRTVLTCIGLGGVGYSIQAATYFAALNYMSAAIVAQLLYTYPALVLIISVVLRRERAERSKVAALACSVLGLTLLLGAGAAPGSVVPMGVLLAVSAAVIYALYITVATGLPAAADVYLSSAIISTSAAISLTGFGVVTSSLHAPSPSGWAWIAVLAIMTTLIAVSAFLAGMRLVGASNAAILSCLEPVVTAVSAFLVYSERTSAIQIVGGAVVLAAVVALQRR